jgi:hypothetical protein
VSTFASLVTFARLSTCDQDRLLLKKLKTRYAAPIESEIKVAYVQQ